MRRYLPIFVALGIGLYAAGSVVKVTDIQGVAFQSPLTGQLVHNVTGVVTAKVSPNCLLVFSGDLFYVLS